MSAIDDLNSVPPQPEISEGNQVFHEKSYNLYLWIRTKLVPAMIELRDLIINAVTGAFSGTSTTSVTVVDTGEVSLVTNSGRSFKPGTPFRLAYLTDPRIYIDGICKTYNATTGDLEFYALAKAGSGSYANWSLTIIPSGGGLAGLGSNTFTGAQFVPDDPYDASGWNGSTAVPTKNAIRNALVGLISGLPLIRNVANDPTLASNSNSETASTAWVKLLAGTGSFNNMQVFTSSGPFTGPAGVTKVEAIVVGGSGGTTTGGTSSFDSFCSASGGGAELSNSSLIPAGGVGSGGNLNVTGQTGGVGRVRGSPPTSTDVEFASGGVSAFGLGRGSNISVSSINQPYIRGGAGGGGAIGIYTITPGNNYSVTVGASGGNGASAGVVILRW